MEHLNSLIRLVAEGGWRFGVPLALIGAAVLVAHKAGRPEPNALAAFIGWAAIAAIAGAAFTIVSLVTGILAALSSWRARRNDQREYTSNLMANLMAMTPVEAVLLRDILRSRAPRLQVNRLNQTWGLVEKGILRTVGGSSLEPICEVPRPLVENREQIIAGIEKQMREHSAFRQLRHRLNEPSG